MLISLQSMFTGNLTQ